MMSDVEWIPAKKSGGKDQRRRRKDRHKVRSKWQRGTFVAWDTEGAEVDGEHRLIVIANSRGDILKNSRGIRTHQALEFIASGMERHKGATHVGFAFSYDANMILRDCPRPIVERLWAGSWARIAGKNVSYIPRKSFYISPGGVIWDIFGFCQSTFVKALESYGIDAPLDSIEAMKRERSNFKAANIDVIGDYCVSECLALEKLAGVIREYFDFAGLKLSRFDGAGAAAASLMQKEGVARYMGRLNAELDHACRFAYFGGRIECLKYGHTEAPIYGYDINSAYPSAAVTLPCLACGRWVHEYAQGLSAELFALYRVRWDLDHSLTAMMPFPWRSPQGHVYFPPKGEGWYWAPEVEAAYDNFAYYPASQIEILERWVYVPGCKHVPFGFVPRVYDQRREWKAKGIGAEKALKLSLNSLYGKLAQQVGRRGKPRWHNLAWAGWITSVTRAKLYRAAMQAPNSAVMLATDAVYSTKPLSISESGELGGWSAAEYAGATIVQSGVYWLGADTKPAGSRGFDADSLDRAAIIAAWKARKQSYTASHTHFIGMGRALAQNFDLWCKWLEEPRELSLNAGGTKRIEISRPNPHRELVDTWPWQPLQYYVAPDSTPITRPWDPEPLRDWPATFARESLEWKF